MFHTGRIGWFQLCQIEGTEKVCDAGMGKRGGKRTVLWEAVGWVPCDGNSEASSDLSHVGAGTRDNALLWRQCFQGLWHFYRLSV